MLGFQFGRVVMSVPTQVSFFPDYEFDELMNWNLNKRICFSIYMKPNSFVLANNNFHGFAKFQKVMYEPVWVQFLAILVLA